MKKTSWKARAKRWGAALLFPVLRVFVGLLARTRTLDAFGALMGWFGYHFSKKGKSLALANLKVAFGDEKNEKEMDEIYRVSLVESAQNLLELFSIAARAYGSKDLLSRVRFEGLEHLDAALAQGKGVIALGAHLGSFAMMLCALCARGYPMAVVYKEAKDMQEGFYKNMMSYYGVIPIAFSGEAGMTRAILRALREGKVVLLQIDQGKKNGVWARFFKRLVKTAAGPAVISQRTGAPVVPMFSFRDKKQHVVEISPPLNLKKSPDRQEDILFNTQIMSDVLEKAIREHPEAWLWRYRRFRKSRLLPEVQEASRQEAVEQ